MDFDSNLIRSEAVFDGDYYNFTMGSPVEVTSIKSSHCNRIASDVLSKDTVDDKLMIRYSPTNKVRFSYDFVNGDTKFAGCNILKDAGVVVIGTPQECGMSNGILAFSGFLSANGLVESERPVLCSERMKSSVTDRVRLLAVGVRGDGLYGLYYLPPVKGLYVGGTGNTAVSSTTYKVVNAKGYAPFYLEDWFDKTKVRELGCGTGV